MRYDVSISRALFFVLFLVVIVCLLRRQRVNKIPTGLKNPRWKDSAIEMMTK